jgi:hypothetical protein
MKIRVFSIVFLIILFSCSSETDNKKDGYIQVYNTDKVNFTDLFEEYELIFPESTDLALVGVSIERLEKHRDKIFLLNRTNKGYNILCFDTNGHFLFTIDKKGNGPGEYSALKDFLIDKQLDAILLDVVGNQYGFDEYMYFDLGGNYLYSKKGPDLSGITHFMMEFNDSLYIALSRCAHRENCEEIVFLDRQSLALKEFISCTDQFTAEVIPRLSLCKANDTFFFYDGNDVISDISTESGYKSPVYFVDFGSQQRELKEKFAGKTHEEILTLHQKTFQNKTLRTTIRFLCNEKYFAINYSENKSVKNSYDVRYQTVFYDLETKKSYNTSNMNFDIFNSVQNDRMEIVGCAEGYFYAVLNSPFSEEEKREIVKSKYLPEESKQALLNMDEESNPIIMMFK